MTAKDCMDTENESKEESEENGTSIGSQCKSQTVNKLGVKKTANLEGVTYVEETEKVCN